jgi:transcription termination factor Rho
MKKFTDIKDKISVDQDDLKDLKKLISFSIIGESKDHPVTINVDEEAIKKIEKLFNAKHVKLLTELKSILQSTKNINAIDAIIENLTKTQGDDKNI